MKKAEGTLSFSNMQVRDQVYKSLTSAQRTGLHLHLLEVRESEEQSDELRRRLTLILTSLLPTLLPYLTPYVNISFFATLFARRSC